MSFDAKPLPLTLMPSEVILTAIIVIALDVPLGYSYRFGNNSRYTYDRIQHWLSQCSPARHPECHSHLKDKLPGLPTRFLRIDNLKVVQLVETCTLTEHPDYVTLSHCWGGVEPFTLTRATRDTLHSGLKTNKLPKSFRDAVEITLKLGKRYIWIDSLCIYQDDLSDWKEEARRMADVYSGSYCNIASTSAANPMGGCFGNRDRRFLAPVSLKFDDNLPESAWLVCPRGLWANQMAHLPLLGRGWVWQERLLAPRTVHFSHQQIYWECSHLLACEAFPRGYALTSKEVGSLVSFEIHPKHGGPNTMDNWNNIISSYSRSHLTNARDKLVAISGVATRMGSDGVRGSYYAGLWEKTFFWNFCWSVNHVDYDAKTFVQDDLAPSWSWASVTPPVSFLATEKVGVLFPFLTLIEVVRGQERKQITLDGLSRMCAWMVRVEGPLYAVSFLAMNCTSSISGHEFSRYWQEGGDMFYTSVAEIATIPASGGRTVQSINARVHWDRGHDNCTKSDANQCYLLNREFYVLGSFPSAYPEPLGIFDSHLLLERLQGGEAGKFQRVGHIRVWYELLQGGLFIDGAESLPAGSFESRRIVRDEHGNTKHLYTISIF